MPALSSFPVVARIGIALLLVGGGLGLVGCDGGGSSAEPPPPPTNVQATAQDGTVTLSWEGGASASGYNVYRDTTAGGDVGESPLNGSSPLGETSFTDTSVETGTQYYYRVTSVGEGGESDLSSEVTVRPFPSPPSRP